MKTNYDEWKEFFTFVYFNPEIVFIALHSKYHAKVEVWYSVHFILNGGISMKFQSVRVNNIKSKHCGHYYFNNFRMYSKAKVKQMRIGNYYFNHFVL